MPKTKLVTSNKDIPMYSLLRSQAEVKNTGPKIIDDMSTVFPAEITDETSVLSYHCGQSFPIAITKNNFLRLTTWHLTIPLNGQLLPKIIEALKQDIAYHDTSVFVLQGVKPASHPGHDTSLISFDIMAELQKGLGEVWQGIQGEGGLITFYNTQKLTLQKDIEQEQERFLLMPLYKPKLASTADNNLQTIFKDNNSSRLVKIVNIHKLEACEFNTGVNVYDTQIYVNAFRTEYFLHPDILTIAIGDFGLRLPAPDVFQKDNRTSLRKELTYDCTDACFVHDSKTKSAGFRQMNTDDLFSGSLDGERRVQHVKRVPFASYTLNKLKKEEEARNLNIVMFQSHQLFSMGPTVMDVQKHFHENSYSLSIETFFHSKAICSGLIHLDTFIG